MMLGARSGSSFGKKKPGSGALYLKRRWIFKSLFLIILKAFFFVSILLVSRRTIGVLDSENQPGSGKIRNGSWALGLTGDVLHQKYEKRLLKLSIIFIQQNFNNLPSFEVQYRAPDPVIGQNRILIPVSLTLVTLLYDFN